jgi:hypothetical protein
MNDYDTSAASRLAIKDLCRDGPTQEVYREMLNRVLANSKGPVSADQFKRVIVMGVMNKIEERKECIFERRRGPKSIPDSYRVDPDAVVEVEFADGTRMRLGKGDEKGDYVSAIEIYEWLSAAEQSQSP